MDAATLIADLTYQTTISRRAAILPTLSKSFRELLVDVPADSLLFGSELTQKIKDAKSAESISKVIKANPLPRSLPPSAKMPLNYRGPGARVPFSPVVGNYGQTSAPRPKIPFKKRGLKSTSKQPDQRQPASRHQPYQKRDK